MRQTQSQSTLFVFNKQEITDIDGRRDQGQIPKWRMWIATCVTVRNKSHTASREGKGNTLGYGMRLFTFT